MRSMRESWGRRNGTALAARASRLWAAVAASSDVVALAVVCLASVWMIGTVDLAEAFSEWSSAYESWEVDELPYMVLVLACGFGVYALRWRRQRRREVERRVAEERRRAAAVEAARAANRAKSIFLATMSHELRTPLNAILGFSEVIRSQAYGLQNCAKYREYADDIHRSGEHLLGVIDAVLDMAKIEACCVDLAEVDLDVGAIVGEAVTKVSDVARARNIRVELALGPLPALHGDERAVRQIFTNLLANAVKYNVTGGAVVVEGTIEPEGELALTVRDTGIGIAPEDIPNVVKPFVQIRDASFAETDGTGLGMAIVDELVAVHGGRLEINSKPGVGTAVVVKFPAKRVRPRPAAAVDRLAS